MTQKSPRHRQLRHTAIHEAGHTVIAHRLDLYPGEVTIVPNVEANEAGCGIIEDPWAVQYAWEQKDKYRAIETIYRGRIIVYMAGREAEMEILGSCRGGDGGDQYQIGLMMEEVLTAARDRDEEDAAWQRLEARLRRFTRALVRSHRHAIERVADALFKQRTLTREQVDAILANAGGVS